MTDKEINNVLEDMVVISDTREQKNQHILQYFDENKIPYIVGKLNSADYTMYLPNYPHLNLDKQFLVERKGSLDELAGNFTKGRDRFIREFDRLEDGQSIHMVLENFTIKKLMNGNYRSKFPSKSYLASLMTWCIRYKCPVWTVTTDESPVVIYNVLKYELRERLIEMRKEDSKC